jgi:hypothetical protein
VEGYAEHARTDADALADIHDVAAALRGAIGDLARAPAGT